MKTKEIVEKVVGLFLESRFEEALNYMTEDVRMGWPGYFDLAPGKKAFRTFFKDMPEIISSGIEEIIGEGATVAATGHITSKFKNGTIKKSFFSDIYTFDGDKIKSIRSYMVFEQEKNKKES